MNQMRLVMELETWTSEYTHNCLPLLGYPFHCLAVPACHPRC